MRHLRAVVVALLLTSSLGLVVVGEPPTARAQDVSEAEDAAEDAEQQADAADGLLSDAVERRSGLEDDLAATLVRLSEINAELTRVSVELEDLRESLTLTDDELEQIDETLQLQAIDAYVRAVETPGVAVVGTSDAESAIVAAATLDRLIDDDQANVASLTVKRRQLEDLRRRYAADLEQVAELQAEADAEAARLEDLLAEADADVASAAAEARAADAEYRAALSELESARARQAEAERQAQRNESTTTTTTTPGDTAATTTTTVAAPAPDDTTTTTTPAPPPEPGGEFPPAVERWRPLVSAYFPSGRVDGALTVIQCESNGDPNAYNPYSGASGLFQFLPSTWATTSPRAGFDGASVFDPEANVGTAAWLTSYYESRGSNPWSPWVCRP